MLCVRVGILLEALGSMADRSRRRRRTPESESLR